MCECVSASVCVCVFAVTAAHIRMYRKAFMHTFLLTTAVYISVVFIYFTYLLFIYLFIHGLATGPESVVFEAKIAAHVSRKLLHGEGLPWVDFHCCCDANRMGCLVIVVLVAVVITGPVVPVRFSASYRGSACLCWGAAPPCKCTPLCFLWYSPVYSGPPCRCTVRLPTWPYNQGSRFKSS